ncbi:MAG TPA: hypothetical protein VJB63_00790 [Patescibacteria group bacterium]|nr:hypothetical protein [Patescibacteria group bacterium]
MEIDKGRQSGNVRKGALVGFVNTEEIIARKIKEQNPDVQIDGYLLVPNDAFRIACDSSTMIDDTYLKHELVTDLRERNYNFVYLGPTLATYAVSGVLREGKVEHIGASVEQMRYETDKSAILDFFPFPLEIIPPTEIVTSYNPDMIKNIFQLMDNRYVLKFVGDYTQKYKGSETGRVRISNATLKDTDEALRFIKDSIDVSGKAMIQKKIDGQDFSANFLIDKNGNTLRLGENVCYKRRDNNDQGPMCDGTGSVSINNTLPFLNDGEREFIQRAIVDVFSSKIKNVTGMPYVGMVNLDLIKSNDGKIYLLEVNCREAGGHTMANIVSGLQNSFFNALEKTQSGKLDRTQPEFKRGVSVVVSAFPRYFPQDIQEGEERQVMKVTKDIPDDIKLYTGWVDLLVQDEKTRTLRLYNSPTLLFEHHNIDLPTARRRLYEVIKQVVNGRLDYRTDIGTMKI